MEDSSQWLIALTIGLPFAALLAWFNKSGSDFKDGFEQNTEKKNKWIINKRDLPPGLGIFSKTRFSLGII